MITCNKCKKRIKNNDYAYEIAVNETTAKEVEGDN